MKPLIDSEQWLPIRGVMKQKLIAEMYGISNGCVSAIKLGRNCTWLAGLDKEEFVHAPTD